jgi:hypothetical protein
VQQLYEKQKHDPPIPRNLPPVAGNITWSRHLLKRIEEPMKQFERNQNVLAGKDAKRIIKMYNKVRECVCGWAMYEGSAQEPAPIMYNTTALHSRLC